MPQMSSIGSFLHTPLRTVRLCDYSRRFSHLPLDIHVDLLSVIVRHLDGADCVPISGGNELPLLVFRSMLGISDDSLVVPRAQISC